MKGQEVAPLGAAHQTPRSHRQPGQRRIDPRPRGVDDCRRFGCRDGIRSRLSFRANFERLAGERGPAVGEHAELGPPLSGQCPRIVQQVHNEPLGICDLRVGIGPEPAGRRRIDAGRACVTDRMQRPGRQPAVLRVEVVQGQADLHHVQPARRSLLAGQRQPQKSSGRRPQPAPAALDRNEQPQRSDELRRQTQQAGPLLERLPHERELRELQIPQAAVNQARRVGRRPKCQVRRVHQPDVRPFQGQFACRGRSVDSPAQNHNRMVEHGARGSSSPERSATDAKVTHAALDAKDIAGRSRGRPVLTRPPQQNLSQEFFAEKWRRVCSAKNSLSLESPVDLAWVPQSGTPSLARNCPLRASGAGKYAPHAALARSTAAVGKADREGEAPADPHARAPYAASSAIR